jgi:carboxyl-terminal processing protease
VARYFTPAGRLIQKPYLDRGEQYRREILTRQDGSGYAPDSLRFVTFLKQRPVYGGGGISPDIPAESDTSRVTGYVGELVRKGILVNYVLRYWRNRRSELLEEFPNPATFMKKFQWTPEDISAVRRLGERQNIPFDEANLKLQQDFVQLS